LELDDYSVGFLKYFRGKSGPLMRIVRTLVPAGKSGSFLKIAGPLLPDDEVKLFANKRPALTQYF
jgi:hypothetical protein